MSRPKRRKARPAAPVSSLREERYRTTEPHRQRHRPSSEVTKRAEGSDGEAGTGAKPAVSVRFVTERLHPTDEGGTTEQHRAAVAFPRRAEAAA